MKKQNKSVIFGSVLIGEKFVFRSIEIIGVEHSGRKPPYEGQQLTVVGGSHRRTKTMSWCGTPRETSPLCRWISSRRGSG